MVIHYGDGLTQAQRDKQQQMLDQLPDNAMDRLRETGTQIWVGRRADETPGWAGLAQETGWTSTDTIADGRQLGSLSFYVGHRNELYISVDHPGGSVNVYVHELGHAIDYQWTGDGRLISDDVEWQSLHNTHIKNNPDIDSYYRGGPSGTNDASGRKELFAEGYAIYNKYGRAALVGWTKSVDAADTMIAIWKRYGVIE
uniref:Metalloprotease n=1 Tax=Mycobacterium phage BabyBack TaxID=3158877 RepID=A0AAU8GTF0_9CAUD